MDNKDMDCFGSQDESIDSDFFDLFTEDDCSHTEEQKLPAESSRSIQDVIDHMKQIISEKRHRLISPFSIDELTSLTTENLSIKYNQKNKEYLLSLFPDHSIPQVRKAQSNNERTSFKQKYSPLIVETKRKMLADFLNICWGQQDFTDEIRSLEQSNPENRPIDFIIYALYHCANQLYPPMTFVNNLTNLEETFDSLRINGLEQRVSDLEEKFRKTNDQVMVVRNEVQETNQRIDDLPDRIVQILSGTERLRANEIADQLNQPRNEINSALYRALQGRVQLHDDMTWSLLPIVEDNPLYGRIESFLDENPGSTALDISRALHEEKAVINNALYSMEHQRRVSKSDTTPPRWFLSNKRSRQEKY